MIAISDQLNIDPAQFERAFDRTPLAVSHNLTDDPLLELDALADLAEGLPSASIEHNKGDLPKIADPDAVERSELPVGEIARTIDTNGSWMVLKNVEQNPAYGKLLDDLLTRVQPMVSDRDGGMMFLQGFVFLSAPGSMTPSHCDPEHNFLLQIRGEKDMNVGEFPDEETERELLERAAGGKVHRNLEWEPANPHCFKLQPGEGVYVPPWAPHWVQNGPKASVSLSITFHTPVNKRKIGVNAFNAKLRRIGLSPAPVGRHPGRDSQKANVQRVLSRLGG